MTWTIKTWLFGGLFALGVSACGSAPVESADVKPNIKIQPADLCEEDDGDCGGSSGGQGGGGWSGEDNFFCCLDDYTFCMEACQHTFRGQLETSCERGCALTQQECNASGN